MGWLLRGAGALFTGGRLLSITGGVTGRGWVEGAGRDVGAGVGREVGLPPGWVCTGVLLLRGALGEVVGAGRPVLPGLPGVCLCGAFTVVPFGPR